MNSYTRLLLLGIGLFAIFGGHAIAGIRCSTALIETGDTEHCVIEQCGEPTYSKHIDNGRNGGDEDYLYFTIGNKEVVIHLIDGYVYSIDGDENI